MSIRDEIKSSCGCGKLFKLEPLVVGNDPCRHMFLSREVNRLLVGPWESQEWKNRCTDLRTTLERFINGGQISVSSNPRKSKKAYLSQLDNASDRAWDIRAQNPSPGIRIIGGFAETDIFIALTWDLRKHLSTYGSQAWRDIILKYHAEWGDLFGTKLPFGHEDRATESNFHEYISERWFFS